MRKFKQTSLVNSCFGKSAEGREFCAGALSLTVIAVIAVLITNSQAGKQSRDIRAT